MGKSPNNEVLNLDLVLLTFLVFFFFFVILHRRRVLLGTLFENSFF
jgi:hypothetical protein